MRAPIEARSPDGRTRGKKIGLGRKEEEEEWRE
jgi:hypothetical protein